eukprot:3352130-Amphidinium_carterae.1
MLPATQDIKLLPFKIVDKSTKPMIAVKVKVEETDGSHGSDSAKTVATKLKVWRDVALTVPCQVMAPEEVSSMVLTKMKAISSDRFDREICPHSFHLKSM